MTNHDHPLFPSWSKVTSFTVRYQRVRRKAGLDEDNSTDSDDDARLRLLLLSYKSNSNPLSTSFHTLITSGHLIQVVKGGQGKLTIHGIEVVT